MVQNSLEDMNAKEIEAEYELFASW